MVIRRCAESGGVVMVMSKSSDDSMLVHVYFAMFKGYLIVMPSRACRMLSRLPRRRNDICAPMLCALVDYSVSLDAKSPSPVMPT